MPRDIIPVKSISEPLVYKTLLENFGYRTLFRHPKMSFMENSKKRRFSLMLNAEVTGKELALFWSFVLETLRFKRLRFLDIIDHIESITEIEPGIFCQWTELLKGLMDAFPVRTLVRILKRKLVAAPAFMEIWESADWGRHGDRVMICSTLEEAESYLDTLLEREMLQRSSGANLNALSRDSL